MKTFRHSDTDLNDYLGQLQSIDLEGSYYLMLLTGHYLAGKRRFIHRVSKSLGCQVTQIDLRKILSRDAQTAGKNIDKIFDQIGEEDKLLFFSHGDSLSGAYTGFTNSHTRYATPQQRYLISKLDKLEKIVMIDVREIHNVDKTLRRYAHSEIQFDQPKSALKRFLWRISSQVKLHGHQFTSDRTLS